MRSTYGDHEDNRNTTRFYLNMGGGSLEIGGGLTWGNEDDEDGGGGELNVSGGATVTCATLAYEGGGRRDWTLNLNGGTISVSGEFRAPGSDPNLAHGDANAFMNIDDGTLECNSFDHNDYPYAMDINEGIFIIHGDVKTAMEADVAAGYITAFNGTEDVLVEIIDGNTWVRADFVRVKAWDETPENYSLNVCPDANNLSWQAGEYCVDDALRRRLNWERLIIGGSTKSTTRAMRVPGWAISGSLRPTPAVCTTRTPETLRYR
jgi:hypothetical protein